MTNYLTREHLEHCRGGDKITLPDDWTAPTWVRDDLQHSARDIGPGWTLKHDGGTDSVPWELRTGTGGIRAFLTADKVAALGIPASAITWAKRDEDEDDVEDVPVVDDEDADEDEDCIGTKYVRVVPDTTGFMDKLNESLGGEYVALGVATDPRLDEYQHERVAALENALRILESRRGPSGGTEGAFASLAGKKADVPMVGKRDLIDVAAFIASEDTGRTEVSA